MALTLSSSPARTATPARPGLKKNLSITLCALLTVVIPAIVIAMVVPQHTASTLAMPDPQTTCPPGAGPLVGDANTCLPAQTD